MERARRGDLQAIGIVLERYRNYLRSIAMRRMAGPVQQRIDASDLVQETMLEAHRCIDRLLGSDEPQLRAALRQILRCNVANAIRDHAGTAKRCVARQQPLDSAAWPLDSDATPSMHVARSEQAARFAEAIGRLPADQAEAVSLRYFEGAGVDEIARTLGRSRAAAAGLLKRALNQLRRWFPAESGLWP